ncbi:hypothetical protein [Thermoanaerobacterium aotearoense]|nr:hypothetical protein [Thermoanaerobacterium aotearoense]
MVASKKGGGKVSTGGKGRKENRPIDWYRIIEILLKLLEIIIKWYTK